MDSMEISASALIAERTRMNLISSNLANANSTRTAEGGPYRRKDAVFAATMDEANAKMGGGVKVVDVVEDQSPPRHHTLMLMPRGMWPTHRIRPRGFEQRDN